MTISQTDRTGACSSQRLALMAGAALAAGMLAGCGNAGAVRSASAADPIARLAQTDGPTGKLVSRAEQSVAQQPENAAMRATLAKTYLRAGRFASAETAFSDAVALGDESGATILGLALAKIGTGSHADAVALLDEHRADVPASDLGLALALAGETSRGVAILADAMRGGETSTKLRQNLAYAYALDGRWAEAKLMAAQDVPADQLDQRMALWALSMLPDRNVDRVAGLVGAPVIRLDPGMPHALALAPAPVSPAAEQQALAQPIELTPPAAPASAQAAELAPVSVVQQNLAVQAAPSAPVRPSVAQAFASMPAKFARTSAPARTAEKLHVPARLRAVPSGTHYVQLGAFSSEQGAKRAWGVYKKRNPALANFRMTISPANVNGKAVWRVAAGGLADRSSATTLCSSVRTRGDACFAYAMPGKAVPAPAVGQTGPQRARR